MKSVLITAGIWGAGIWMVFGFLLGGPGLSIAQSIPTISPLRYFGGGTENVRFISSLTKLLVGGTATTTDSFIETPSLAITDLSNEDCIGVDADGVVQSGVCNTSSVSFGSDDQIPYTNAGGDDFDYSANFVFDGSVIAVGDGTVDVEIGSNGSEGSVGTESNHNLRFVTNSNNRAILTTGGLFGVGTSTPFARINAFQGDQNVNVAPGFMVEGTVEPGIRFRNYDYKTFDLFSGGGDATEYQNKFTIFDRDNNTARLVIDANGNVGIGTTSPYAKLSVVGETIAEHFTATSTTATSTLTNAQITQSLHFFTEIWYSLADFITYIESAIDAIADLTISTRLVIPNGTNPTADDPGEIAWDTTTGQLIIDDNVLDSRLSIFSASKMASTTLADPFIGSYGASATTTLEMNAPYAFTATSIHCQSDTGTFMVEVSDGSNNTESVVCSSTESTQALSTNNSFSEDEQIEVRIGSQTSNASVEFISVKGNKARE